MKMKFPLIERVWSKVKPSIAQYHPWHIGLGTSFYQGNITTYACGQTEGNPSEFHVTFGPWHLTWFRHWFLRKKISKGRYSDDLVALANFW